MTDESSLVAALATAVKWDEELAALKAIAAAEGKLTDLAKELAKANITDIVSLEDLIEKLAGKLGDDDVVAAFKAVGLGEALGGVAAFIKKAQEAEKAVPGSVKALLTRLDGFKPTDASRKIKWALSTGGPQPVVKTARYTLDLSAEAAIVLNAVADAPAGVADKRPLSLGVSGLAKATAGAKIPYSLGSIKGGADAEVTVALNYLFSADQKALFVVAAAGKLGALPDPFSLDAVWKAFATHGDLEAITYSFKGAASAKLDVSLADAAALGAGVIANLGATVSVSASLASTYKLVLSRASAADAPLKLGAALARDRIEGSKFGVSLGLDVDTTALTAPLLAAIKAGADRWSEVLKDIKPYLTPGTWLRDQGLAALEAGLADAIKDESLRAAVVADAKGALGLGATPDSNIVTWLSEQLLGAIDQGSVLAQKKMDAALDGAMGVVTQRLPVLAETDVAERIKGLIEAEVGRVRDGLEASAKTLFDQARNQIQPAIKAAGVTVSAAVKTADDALKGVRELLAKYDTLLKDMIKATEDAAAKKISARLFREETRSREESLALKGFFTGVTDPSRQIFSDLVGGSLDQLSKLFDEPGSPSGFDLVPGESLLTRYSAYKSRDGLEIVFFGINFSAVMSTTVEAKVIVDGAGNVRVDAKSELIKMTSLLGKEREVSLVETAALVRSAQAANAVPAPPRATVELGLGARFSDKGFWFFDKGLSLNDVNDFLARLSDASLLAGADAEALRAAFVGWSGGKDRAINGAIKANLKLKGSALRTLLWANGKGETLDEAERMNIINVAIYCLTQLRGLDPKLFGAGAGVIARSYEEHGAVTTADVVSQFRGRIWPVYGLGDYPNHKLPEAVFTKEDQLKAQYFLDEAVRIEAAIVLITTMRGVYLATPGQDGWDQKRYQAAQKTIADASGRMLQVLSNTALLLGSEVSRRTAAWMWAMALLTRSAEGDQLPMVTVDLTWQPPGDGKAQTVSYGG